MVGQALGARELLMRARPALDVALQHALGAELIDPADPTGGVCFTVEELALTPAGTLHAAALAAVAELAGYLAVLPTLELTEHAVTQTISTQYLRAAHSGERVQVFGTLTRRARALAFVSVTATVADGSKAGRLITVSQITKSVVPG